jgi:uncharacterized membrane protein YkvI
MYVLIPTAILTIGAWVIWRKIQDKKSGFPAQDERTQKVTGKAATYALYVGSYFMIALLFVLIIGKEIFDLSPFDVGDALVASLLVFNFTFLGLRWYFNRKGDF